MPESPIRMLDVPAMTAQNDTGVNRAPANDFSHEQEGYQHGLKPRQLQMIAIGGAIGTGLFLGAGGRLPAPGPPSRSSSLICGVFAFFILRALGELVLHRPSSGSFVSYAREFFGEKFAYAAGWMYFLNWAMTAIVDVTAVALYLHYWRAFTAAPQWLLALIALAVVLAVEPRRGQGVRRDGVLVRAHQGRRARGLPRRRRRLARLRVPRRRPAARRSTPAGPVQRQRRSAPERPAARGSSCRASSSPTPRSSSSARRPARRRTPRRSCRAPSTRSSSASRSSTSARSCCCRCCCPTRRTRPAEPLRHVLLVASAAPQVGDDRGLDHELRRPHRGAVEPQRRALLDRPRAALDGHERLGAEVHDEDVEGRRAVRRHPAHRGASRCSASC